MLVVQMHGEPGSGKSAVARALGTALPAVVLDKDVLKAALLRAGIADPLAGMASYETLFDVAVAIVRQGHDIIIDCPVFWPMVERGSRRVADEAGATYVMLECICPDRDELRRRLATRDAPASQPRVPYDFSHTPGTIEPSCERFTLDTTRPLDEVVAAALGYIRAGVPR